MSQSVVVGSAVSPTEVRVRLDSASLFYGEVVGLSRVDLALGTGITGIVGPNGSGKSTLMRVLTGLHAPSEGSVSVLGGDPFTDPSVREQITFVPATENFYDGLSAFRNLQIGFLARGHSGAQAKESAGRALDLVHLTEHGTRRYGTWSRGMRQRLKIGLAFVLDSKLVLLDEPFLGVDPPSRIELRNTIQRLGEGDRTVVISSHVLHEVETLTDRVGVLAHGRLLGFGRIQTILRELRDRHPHRILLELDHPRRLGAALLSMPHVRELKVLDAERLEFVTEHPESAYRELAAAVVKTGTSVRFLEAMNDSLEAVFAQVTEAGSRRL